MTHNDFRKATMKDYTAFDIHYCAFKRGKEHQIEKMIKRKARRNDKLAVKELLLQAEQFNRQIKIIKNF